MTLWQTAEIAFDLFSFPVILKSIQYKKIETIPIDTKYKMIISLKWYHTAKKSVAKV